MEEQPDLTFPRLVEEKVTIPPKFKLSQLPNFEFGYGGFGNQARILCFWPNLARKGGTTRYLQFVKNKWSTIWWEQVVYPALEKASGNESVIMMKIPQTFKEAEPAARRNGGTLGTTGFEVPTTLFPKMVEIMRDIVANSGSKGELHQFHGFFFHILMKGTKISKFSAFQLSLLTVI